MPTSKKAKSSISLRLKNKLSKAKRRIFKHVWLIRISAIAIVLIIVAIIGYFIHQSRITSFVAPAVNFIFTSNAEVQSENGRTNILILGKGGEGHDGADLTDTIIFSSISKTDNSVVLVSIPRDVYLVEEQLKINHAYSDAKEQGGTVQGLANAKKIISQLVGQPIHYVVVVDFSAFTKLIDALGGIEVDVERTFTDNKYPIAGAENDLCGLQAGRSADFYTCRYETLTFEKGLQNMSGEIALKFARSRHSLDPLEGTDFARSARQQKVINGIRNKILSTGIIFNPDKISELIKIGEDSIVTDLTVDEAAVLARVSFDARDNLQTYVLDRDLLHEPPISPYRYGGQYVLLPKGANFEAIHGWVENVLP